MAFRRLRYVLRTAISCNRRLHIIGFNLAFEIRTLRKLCEMLSLQLEYKWIIGLLYATICQATVSTMVVMFILGFESRREFGVYLIILYLIFFIISIVVELTPA